MNTLDTDRFLELLQQLQYEDDCRKDNEEFGDAFSYVRQTALSHFEQHIQSRVAKQMRPEEGK